jgi:hypothetical protein
MELSRAAYRLGAPHLKQARLEANTCAPHSGHFQSPGRSGGPPPPAPPAPPPLPASLGGSCGSVSKSIMMLLTTWIQNKKNHNHEHDLQNKNHS